MAVNDVLDDLIDNAEANQIQLDNLIYILGSGLPVAVTGDAPVYDEETGTSWIFAQFSANANGEYLGIYKLTSALFCALLEALDIIAFTAPQPPNTPARLLPCGADPFTGWTVFPALIDLEGETFNQFEIRSATPFEVKARVRPRPTVADKWELTSSSHGQILSRTGDTLTMNAGLQGNGVWYAIIKTIDTNDCAAVNNVEILSGSGGPGALCINCGTAYSEPAWHSLNLQNNCVNRLQVQGSSQFTVKFTFQECS